MNDFKETLGMFLTLLLFAIAAIALSRADKIMALIDRMLTP